jgi:hypothetical protein
MHKSLCDRFSAPVTFGVAAFVIPSMTKAFNAASHGVFNDIPNIPMEMLVHAGMIGWLGGVVGEAIAQIALHSKLKNYGMTKKSNFLQGTQLASYGVTYIATGLMNSPV